MKYNLVFDVLNQSYQYRNVENNWKKQNKNKNSCWTAINVMNIKTRFKKSGSMNAKSAGKTK